MKTISEIAKLCGVTRQSIYSKVNSKDLQDKLTPHKHENSKGITVFDDAGVEIICCQFNSKPDSKPDKKLDNNLTAILQAENEFLKEQIKEKDKHINDQSEQLKNFQILLKQEQDYNSSRPFILRLFAPKDKKEK